MSGKEYRLIGKLYHECVKPQKIVPNVDNFFDLVLDVPCNTPTQSGILQYDYFTASTLIEFKKKLSDQEKYIKNLDKFFGILSSEQKNEFNEKLITITKNVTSFSNTVIRSPKDETEDKIELYDEREKTKLSSYYAAKNNNYNLSYNVFLLIHLAVYKRLPSNFFFGINYQNDLDEFNEEVTCKYGVTSKPGTRAIITLAERSIEKDNKEPNLFALYEYADMLYYGSENGPTKNFKAAYENYKRISSTNNNSPCHPLAQWTLAYIYYNYHQPKTELENCDNIEEIDDMSRLEQIEKAIENASYAYNLVNNPAAANILGKICMITEENLEGIEETRQKYNLKSAEDYFTDAVEQNYIYAYANLANIYLEKIFTDENNQIEHLNNYLLTLKKQADQYEPWAANTLGLFYLNGVIKSRNNEENTKTFDEYIDRNRSFLFFSQATIYFNDKNSGWAYANMIIYFPRKYIADEKYTLLKSHLTRLSKINNLAAIAFVKEHFLNTYKVFETEDFCRQLLSVLDEEKKDD